MAAAWILTAPQALAATPRAVWGLAALILSLPLMQLVPLPPAVWHSLPGREGQQAALELVGAEDSWRSLSLSPARTLTSLLAAASALLVMVMASALDRSARWKLLWTIALVGGLTLLLGTAQMSGGSGNPFRFYDAEFEFVSGFQANRNSTADVLLIALLAGSAVMRHLADQKRIQLGRLQFAGVVLAFDAVLIIGLVLTGSRAGMLLLPVALLFQYIILQPDNRIHAQRLLASLAAFAALAVIAVVTLRNNRAIDAVLSRFTPEGEFRLELWRDALFAMNQYWPVGSGQGTFVPVMIAVERLEVIDPTLPNRAHNDYLELAVGGGLPGMIILAAASLWIGLAALRALRQAKQADRGQILFAIGTLTVIALHSLVDYPLRSMSLAAVAAVAVGLLLPARSTQPINPRG
ncbi:MAG: O-antigen ligase family protein [Novosphingobium sp.]